MVLAGSGVYRDTDHINNSKAAFFCDLDLIAHEVGNYCGIWFYFCQPGIRVILYTQKQQEGYYSPLAALIICTRN
jgi:hypothetical protein